ncbi:MAG: hypothetical protein CMN30_28900 [Sandaracinus sp.]|nr:hypothetical protein [Sandaracinus sp.]
MTTVAALAATRRQLVAALHCGGDTPRRVHLRADRTLHGRGDLAEHLAALAAAVVIPETLHRFDPVVVHLHAHGLFVWLAPIPIVEAIAHLVGVRSSAPLTLAAALARAPSIPILAHRLRPLPPPDPRQLCLPLPHSS